MALDSCIFIRAEATGSSLQHAARRSGVGRCFNAIGISTLLNRDLTPTLEGAEWSALRLAFATRHVLTHNFELADIRFMNITGSGVIGQRVQVTRTFAERTLTLVEPLVQEMA